MELTGLLAPRLWHRQPRGNVAFLLGCQRRRRTERGAVRSAETPSPGRVCARTQPHRPLPVIGARARTIPRRVPSPHISTTITELVTCTSTQPALIFYESSYFFIFKSTVYCISLEVLKYTVQISVKSYILGKLEYLITFIFVIYLHLWKCKHFSCK